jgi:glycine C-acetyltransferase
MLGEAGVAVEMAQRLLAEGILVVAFSYPVVPRGKARIRTQLSTAHTLEDLDKALQTFIRVGKSMGVLK